MVNVVYALVFVWLLSPGTILLRFFSMLLHIGSLPLCIRLDSVNHTSSMSLQTELWLSRLKLCLVVCHN